MAQVGTWVGFSYKGRKELLEFPYDTLFYLLRTSTTAPSTVWPQTVIMASTHKDNLHSNLKKSVFKASGSEL